MPWQSRPISHPKEAQLWKTSPVAVEVSVLFGGHMGLVGRLHTTAQNRQAVFGSLFVSEA